MTDIQEGQFHRNAGKYKEHYFMRNPDDGTSDIYKYVGDASFVQNRSLVCIVARIRDLQVCYIPRGVFTTHARVCSPEELEAALKTVERHKIKQVQRKPGLIK